MGPQYRPVPNYSGYCFDPDIRSLGTISSLKHTYYSTRILQIRLILSVSYQRRMNFIHSIHLAIHLPQLTVNTIFSVIHAYIQSTIGTSPTPISPTHIIPTSPTSTSLIDEAISQDLKPFLRRLLILFPIRPLCSDR